MNRLQNSIVRFLKYVIDLENLIILLNIGQSILHSRQVPSIHFCYAGEGVESKKISNDQELIQSDPTPCPQNQKRNN